VPPSSRNKSSLSRLLKKPKYIYIFVLAVFGTYSRQYVHEVIDGFVVFAFVNYVEAFSEGFGSARGKEDPKLSALED
jgi:hypothetical protein